MSEVQVKLVLFDIDGTLVKHVEEHVPLAVNRFVHAATEVYGVTPDIDWRAHNGSIDKKIAWDIVKDMGITRGVFLKGFPHYSDVMHRLLVASGQKAQLYRMIPDAVQLVEILADRNDVFLGVLTGNVRKIAEWKLIHAGVPDVFSFGLYGEEADSRTELAHTVFEKAERFFGRAFAPADIVVIGDTVHDVRCGKAIGAVTIAVTTGGHDAEKLRLEQPDFLADSLMSSEVLRFFRVEKKAKVGHNTSI